MNTIKIINNNINAGKFYPNLKSDAIRVKSDNHLFPYYNIFISKNIINASKFNESSDQETSNYNLTEISPLNSLVGNPPKGSLPALLCESAIRTVNRSIISENIVSGYYYDSLIVCNNDCSIVGNKLNAEALSGIFANKNCNIINNIIYGFKNYGIQATGVNISGNTISRDSSKNILAFISVDENSENDTTIVVDNCFSHDTVDGIDDENVKFINNCIVERNAPKYVIKSPIINIRSVKKIDDMRKITGMEHGEVCLVVGDEGTDPKQTAQGLWIFNKGAFQKDISPIKLSEISGESIVKSDVQMFAQKADDDSGYWYWSDYSRLNADPFGLPRVIGDTLEVSQNSNEGNRIGVPKLTVDTDGLLKVYNGAAIGIGGEDSSLNIKPGGSIYVENGGVIENKGFILKSNYIYLHLSSYEVKKDTWSEYVEIRPDVQYDEFIIEGLDHAHKHPYIYLSVDQNNDKKYVGRRIKFRISGGRYYRIVRSFEKITSENSEKKTIIENYVYNYKPNEFDYTFKYSEFKIGNLIDSVRWIEYILCESETGFLSWEASAYEGFASWVQYDSDVLSEITSRFREMRGWGIALGGGILIPASEFLEYGLEAIGLKDKEEPKIPLYVAVL